MSSTVDAVPPSRAASPPPTTPPRQRPSYRLGRWDITYSPYLYIAPFFVLFGIFGLFPLLYTAYVSLFDYELLSGTKEFAGLENYRVLMADAQFWNAAYNTVGIFILSTVPQLIVALLLANLLNRQMRARTLLRMGILIPNITSVAAVGIIFALIFADRYGLINWLLGTVGVDPVAWRDNRYASWFAVAFMVDWRWTGYNALIYLGAMQAIPKDLYESASLDGASAWRQFWAITVPLIRPTILFTVIISTIGGFQIFTEPLMYGFGLVRGGADHQFQTLAMYIYERTFTGNAEYGYGSAMSWLLFMMIIIFALINFVLIRRSVKGDEK
ncbi:sugar ABC transporter permease [Micromonospora sp. DR5-3]|uniref:carbohydrate ABC transporter permease n=1 Tax=unclassified Micromonospora TaxID=2617518 RepID=UPI0011DBAF50|nr:MULTISPECIES: sugar ABC transporter permease [unclassified Micromonospora]MCW3813254.1 sugar ABC transporter permease [Micromonospora sp. DR5-3]TYC24645.1 sugar ABC transporter permease [Micromonospora sp. MP36]